MSNGTTGIVVFPASSYEAAQKAADRLLEAGFPRAAMFVEQSGEQYEVTLHTKEANRRRAEKAVYGNGYLGKLALAGAVVALGGALWSLWEKNRADRHQGAASSQPSDRHSLRYHTARSDMASTRLPDTTPLGSGGATNTRHQQATEIDPMPIS